MCSFCWQKCGPRLKLFFRLEIFSTFRGVHTLIFTYVLCIFIGLQEEPVNFYREKRSLTLVTGHLFTFLMVLSLIRLVTTQTLVSENQTIWKLKILLRTIEAALLITKCNDRFVKNKRYQETGKEYFTIVEMIVKEQYLIPDYAKPSPPSTPQTHTHQQKGHCLPNDLCPSHLQPTQVFFPIPITTNAKVFLSHNCPKIKWKNLFHKSWKFA